MIQKKYLMNINFKHIIGSFPQKTSLGPNLIISAHNNQTCKISPIVIFLTRIKYCSSVAVLSSNNLLQ